jgi:predicted Fe-Mo cluster-binding NifX family protein
MKIAVTSQNRRDITGHAGRCRRFRVFGVDVLIAGGIGSGLQARLARKGIEAVVTTETDPDRAVALWLAHSLVRAAPMRTVQATASTTRATVAAAVAAATAPECASRPASRVPCGLPQPA